MKKGDLARVEVKRIGNYYEGFRPLIRFRDNSVGEVAQILEDKVTLRFLTIYECRGVKGYEEEYVEFLKEDIRVLSEEEIKEYRFKGQNNIANKN